jgi:N-acetylglucosamine-6-phosphate deacetylase
LQHRALGNSVFYTTDSMAAAGAPPGRYTIGNLTIAVGANQIVRQPGKTNFAGSALRPEEGVFRAAEMLHSPWPEAWVRFSVTPAKLMGVRNEIAVGQPATFCRLKLAPDGSLVDLQTEWNG